MKQLTRKLLSLVLALSMLLTLLPAAVLADEVTPPTPIEAETPSPEVIPPEISPSPEPPPPPLDPPVDQQADVVDAPTFTIAADGTISGDITLKGLEPGKRVEIIFVSNFDLTKGTTTINEANNFNAQETNYHPEYVVGRITNIVKIMPYAHYSYTAPIGVTVGQEVKLTIGQELTVTSSRGSINATTIEGIINKNGYMASPTAGQYPYSVFLGTDVSLFRRYNTGVSAITPTPELSASPPTQTLQLNSPAGGELTYTISNANNTNTATATNVKPTIIMDADSPADPGFAVSLTSTTIAKGGSASLTIIAPSTITRQDKPYKGKIRITAKDFSPATPLEVEFIFKYPTPGRLEMIPRAEGKRIDISWDGTNIPTADKLGLTVQNVGGSDVTIKSIPTVTGGLSEVEIDGGPAVVTGFAKDTAITVGNTKSGALSAVDWVGKVAGAVTGSIIIEYTSNGNNYSLEIPVSLVREGQPVLEAIPASVSFETSTGVGITRQIKIRNNGTVKAYLDHTETYSLFINADMSIYTIMPTGIPEVLEPGETSDWITFTLPAEKALMDDTDTFVLVYSVNPADPEAGFEPISGLYIPVNLTITGTAPSLKITPEVEQVWTYNTGGGPVGKDFTITNSGTDTATEVTVKLVGTDADKFTLSAAGVTSNPDGSLTLSNIVHTSGSNTTGFTVTPVSQAVPDTYAAKVVVTYEGGTLTAPQSSNLVGLKQVVQAATFTATVKTKVDGTLSSDGVYKVELQKGDDAAMRTEMVATAGEYTLDNCDVGATYKVFVNGVEITESGKTVTDATAVEVDLYSLTVTEGMGAQANSAKIAAGDYTGANAKATIALPAGMVATLTATKANGYKDPVIWENGENTVTSPYTIPNSGPTTLTASFGPIPVALSGNVEGTGTYGDTVVSVTFPTVTKPDVNDTITYEVKAKNADDSTYAVSKEIGGLTLSWNATNGFTWSGRPYQIGAVEYTIQATSTLNNTKATADVKVTMDKATPEFTIGLIGSTNPKQGDATNAHVEVKTFSAPYHDGTSWTDLAKGSLDTVANWSYNTNTLTGTSTDVAATINSYKDAKYTGIYKTKTSNTVNVTATATYKVTVTVNKNGSKDTSVDSGIIQLVDGGGSKYASLSVNGGVAIIYDVPAGNYTIYRGVGADPATTLDVTANITADTAITLNYYDVKFGTPINGKYIGNTDTKTVLVGSATLSGFDLLTTEGIGNYELNTWTQDIAAGDFSGGTGVKYTHWNIKLGHSGTSEITLTPTFQATGVDATVELTLDGSGYSGQSVVLKQGDSPIATATTAADGKAHFTNIAKGEYAVWAGEAGRETDTKTTFNIQSENVNHTVKYSTVSIGGVTPPAGRTDTTVFTIKATLDGVLPETTVTNGTVVLAGTKVNFEVIPAAKVSEFDYNATWQNTINATTASKTYDGSSPAPSAVTATLARNLYAVNGSVNGSGTPTGITLTGTALDGAPVNISGTLGAVGTANSYTFSNVPASDATGYTVTLAVDSKTKITSPNAAGTAAVTVVPDQAIQNDKFTFVIEGKTYFITLNGGADNANANGAENKFYGETPTGTTVTVRSTGNSTVTGLTYTLGGTDAASFDLSGARATSLASTEETSFTLMPKTGLDAKTSYVATITVKGTELPAAGVVYTYTYTVTQKPITAVTIKGSAKDGGKLEVDKVQGVIESALTDAKTLSYLWESSTNGTTWTTTGRTESTYDVTNADAGKYLRLAVTGSVNYSGTVYSAAAGPVDYTGVITVQVDSGDIQAVGTDYMVNLVPTTSGATISTFIVEAVGNTVKFSTEPGALTGGVEYEIHISPRSGVTDSGDLVKLMNGASPVTITGASQSRTVDYFTAAVNAATVASNAYATLLASDVTISAYVGTAATGDSIGTVKKGTTDIYSTAVLSGTEITYQITYADPTGKYDYSATWNGGAAGTGNPANTATKTVTYGSKTAAVGAELALNVYNVTGAVDGGVDTATISGTTAEGVTLVTANHTVSINGTTATFSGVPKGTYTFTATSKPKFTINNPDDFQNVSVAAGSTTNKFAFTTTGTFTIDGTVKLDGVDWEGAAVAWGTETSTVTGGRYSITVTSTAGAVKHDLVISKDSDSYMAEKDMTITKDATTDYILYHVEVKAGSNGSLTGPVSPNAIYKESTSINLGTPTPNTGYKFGAWKLDGPGTAPAPGFTVPSIGIGSITLTAEFEHADITLSAPGDKTYTYGQAEITELLTEASANGATFTYELTGLPYGLKLGTSGGKPAITGRPANVTSDAVAVTYKAISAVDSAKTASVTFTIKVNPAPVTVTSGKDNSKNHYVGDSASTAVTAPGLSGSTPYYNGDTGNPYDNANWKTLTIDDVDFTYSPDTLATDTTQVTINVSGTKNTANTSDGDQTLTNVWKVTPATPAVDITASYTVTIDVTVDGNAYNAYNGKKVTISGTSTVGNESISEEGTLNGDTVQIGKIPAGSYTVSIADGPSKSSVAVSGNTTVTFEHFTVTAAKDKSAKTATVNGGATAIALKNANVTMFAEPTDGYDSTKLKWNDGTTDVTLGVGGTYEVQGTVTLTAVYEASAIDYPVTDQNGQVNKPWDGGNINTATGEAGVTFTYALKSGETLPEGLKMEANDGVITGTPTKAYTTGKEVKIIATASTGISKEATWKFIIAKGTQSKPELNKTDCTGYNTGDGKLWITGYDPANADLYEWSTDGSTWDNPAHGTWSAGEGKFINAAPNTYYVRLKGTDDLNPSDADSKTVANGDKYTGNVKVLLDKTVNYNGKITGVKFVASDASEIAASNTAGIWSSAELLNSKGEYTVHVQANGAWVETPSKVSSANEPAKTGADVNFYSVKFQGTTTVSHFGGSGGPLSAKNVTATVSNNDVVLSGTEVTFTVETWTEDYALSWTNASSAAADKNPGVKKYEDVVDTVIATLTENTHTVTGTIDTATLGGNAAHVEKVTFTHATRGAMDAAITGSSLSVTLPIGDYTISASILAEHQGTTVLKKIQVNNVGEATTASYNVATNGNKSYTVVLEGAKYSYEILHNTTKVTGRTWDPVTYSYADRPEEQVVTIKNTGNRPLTNVTVMGSDAAFELTNLEAGTTINEGGIATFRIQPQLGQNANAYAVTYTVKTDEDASLDIGVGKTYEAKITVNRQPIILATLNIANAPVTGQNLGSASVTGSEPVGSFNVGSTAWTDGHTVAVAGKAYTASVTLAANSNYVFVDGNKGSYTLNGTVYAIDIAANGATSITLTYTFPPTAPTISVAAAAAGKKYDQIDATATVDVTAAVQYIRSLTTIAPADLEKETTWSGANTAGSFTSLFSYTTYYIYARARVDLGGGVVSEWSYSNEATATTFHKVTVDLNGGKMLVKPTPEATVGVEHTKTLDIEVTPQDHYVFDTWVITGNGGAVDKQEKAATYDSTTATIGDITLQATYKATYGVTYDLNGSSATDAPIENKEYAAGEDITVAAYSGTRTGYAFKGWSTDKTAVSGTENPGTIAMMAQAAPGDKLTLYAIWGTVGIDAAAVAMSNGTYDMDYSYAKDQITAKYRDAANTAVPQGNLIFAQKAPGSGETDLGTLGLTLNADGSITGKPNKTGTFTFTVTVTDSNVAPKTGTGASDDVKMTLTIEAAVINQVDITNLTGPSVGVVKSATATIPTTDGYLNSTTADSGKTTVTWSGSGFGSGGEFLAGGTYTATMVLMVDDNHAFANSVTATADSGAVTTPVAPSGGTVTVVVTYPALAPATPDVDAEKVDYESGKLKSLTVTSAQDVTFYYLIQPKATLAPVNGDALISSSGVISVTGTVSGTTATWNTGETRTGLAPNTEYTVYAVAKVGSTGAVSEIGTRTFKTDYKVIVETDGNGAVKIGSDDATKVQQIKSVAENGTLALVTQGDVGYTFKEWMGDSGYINTSTNILTASGTPTNGTITVKATFQKFYKVGYELNGSTGAPVTGDAPTDDTQYADPAGSITLKPGTGFSRTGFNFLGWHYNEASKTALSVLTLQQLIDAQTVTDGTAPAAGFTFKLYAIWEGIAPTFAGQNLTAEFNMGNTVGQFPDITLSASGGTGSYTYEMRTTGDGSHNYPDAFLEVADGKLKLITDKRIGDVKTYTFVVRANDTQNGTHTDATFTLTVSAQQPDKGTMVYSTDTFYTGDLTKNAQTSASVVKDKYTGDEIQSQGSWTGNPDKFAEGSTEYTFTFKVAGANANNYLTVEDKWTYNAQKRDLQISVDANGAHTETYDSARGGTLITVTVKNDGTTDFASVAVVADAPNHFGGATIASSGTLTAGSTTTFTFTRPGNKAVGEYAPTFTVTGTAADARTATATYAYTLTVDPAEIDAAVITDLGVPTLGQKPVMGSMGAKNDTDTVNKDKYKVTNVTWAGAIDSTGNFQPGVKYTATITLTMDTDNYVFVPGTVNPIGNGYTVNGDESDTAPATVRKPQVTIMGGKNKVATITVTFDGLAAANLAVTAKGTKWNEGVIEKFEATSGVPLTFYYVVSDKDNETATPAEVLAAATSGNAGFAGEIKGRGSKDGGADANGKSTWTGAQAITGLAAHKDYWVYAVAQPKDDTTGTLTAVVKQQLTTFYKVTVEATEGGKVTGTSLTGNEVDENTGETISVETSTAVTAVPKTGGGWAFKEWLVDDARIGAGETTESYTYGPSTADTTLTADFRKLIHGEPSITGKLESGEELSVSQNIVVEKQVKIGDDTVAEFEANDPNLIYKWQYLPLGGSWTDIPGAANTPTWTIPNDISIYAGAKFRVIIEYIKDEDKTVAGGTSQVMASEIGPLDVQLAKPGVKLEPNTTDGGLKATITPSADDTATNSKVDHYEVTLYNPDGSVAVTKQNKDAVNGTTDFTVDFAWAGLDMSKKYTVKVQAIPKDSNGYTASEVAEDEETPAKKPLTLADIDYEWVDRVFNGFTQSPLGKAQVKSGITGAGTVTVHYSNDVADTGAKMDAKAYNMYLTVAEGDRYTALGLTAAGTWTIAQATSTLALTNATGTVTVSQAFNVSGTAGAKVTYSNTDGAKYNDDNTNKQITYKFDLTYEATAAPTGSNVTVGITYTADQLANLTSSKVGEYRFKVIAAYKTPADADFQRDVAEPAQTPIFTLTVNAQQVTGLTLEKNVAENTVEYGKTAGTANNIGVGYYLADTAANAKVMRLDGLKITVTYDVGNPDVYIIGKDTLPAWITWVNGNEADTTISGTNLAFDNNKVTSSELKVTDNTVTSGGVTFTMTAKKLDYTTGSTVASREYNGSNVVTTGTVTVDNALAGDTVELTASSYTLNNANVGQNKPITANGVSISNGADKGFYVLGDQTNGTMNVTPVLVMPIVVTNVSEPAVGGTPSNTATPGANTYTVESVTWDKPMDNGKFKQYEEYTATVKVKPVSGNYMLDTSGANTINGQTPDTVSGPDANGIVTLTYKFPRTKVNFIEVINVVAPVKNEEPKTTANSKEPTLYKVVGGATWDGELEAGKFKPNKTYTVSVKVEPEAGVVMDDTVKGRINPDGSIVTTTKNLDGTYTLTRSWTLTEVPPGPGPGGGGGKLIVTYDLIGNGTSKDELSEEVAKGGKPQNVPKVEAKPGFKFEGWSLENLKPSTEVDKKKLVDPKSVTINEDTTFYAVYTIVGGEHEHYIKGYDTGLFMPGNEITRAQVAAIIARSCLEGFQEKNDYGNGGYNDVPAEHWARSAIAYVTMKGVFVGYDVGSFQPDKPITREEFALVFARMVGLVEAKEMKFVDAAKVAPWAADGVYTAYTKGWIEGYPEDGTFRPQRNIARSEAVKIVNRYLNRGVNGNGVKDVLSQLKLWPDMPEEHWAYYEVLEASNDHTYFYVDGKQPPEVYTKAYIEKATWEK